MKLLTKDGHTLTTIGELYRDDNGDPQIAVAIDGVEVGVFCWQEQYDWHGDVSYALAVESGGGEALAVMNRLDLSWEDLARSRAFQRLDAKAIAMGKANKED